MTKPPAKAKPTEIEGIYAGNPKGFGFVRPLAHDPVRRSLRVHDVFIPPGASAEAIDGDRVRVRLGEDGTGRVTAMLQRGRQRLAGTFMEGGLFRPDAHTIPRALPLESGSAAEIGGGQGGPAGSKTRREPRDRGPGDRAPGDRAPSERGGKGGRRAPRPGDKVIATPAGNGFAVAQVLGRAGDRDVEDLAVMVEMDIAGEFPPDVEREAARFRSGTVSPRDCKGRLDLRGEPTVVTIDPLTAKDFDDAISMRRTRNGGYLLGVHIADVSHYVQEGTALDAEARRRGSSAYLPVNVVPMLPQTLSNGLCSLREGEDRLAMSVLLTYDAGGSLQRAQAGRSVIRSDRRFTYERASRVMEGAGGETQAVSRLLRDMHDLAAKLRQGRSSLVIHEPGVEFVYSPAGDIVEVHTTEGDDAHWVIEEFMLAANREIAGWLLRLREPVLFRHHPPSQQPVELRKFLEVMGIPGARVRSLPELLRHAESAGLGAAATSFLMEVMEAAEYSARNSRHDALGFEHYTHFTSPIRRYADLTVHRTAARHLTPGDWVDIGSQSPAEPVARPGAVAGRGAGRGAGAPSAQRGGRAGKKGARGGGKSDHPTAAPAVLDPISTPELDELAAHLNQRERAIAVAERRLRRRRTLDFLESKGKEPLLGVVLRVLDRGLLVNLPGYLISGFVAAASLGPGPRRLEPHRLVVGERSFQPGLEIQVRIARVDAVRGDLDLELVG